MGWTIEPNGGLGPLRLGMTQTEVAALPVMGKPGHVYRGSGGRIMEYRGLTLPICEYGEGRLDRIVAGRHVEGVRFEGIDVFDVAPPELIRLMETRLGSVTLCQEQLCFTAAGLMLGGYYDARDGQFFEPKIEYHDERSVTLYAPGARRDDCTRAEALSFL